MTVAMIVRLLSALIVLLVAVDDGGYALESRGLLAIAVWWAIGLGFGTRVLPSARPGRGAVAAGGLFTAFALLTLTSAAWAVGDEKVVAEANRAALYLGLFVIAAALPARYRPAVVDGLAAGVVSVALLALASRCFPGLAETGRLTTALPSARARLSYPVGYWNGLAILSALGLPLLLRAAIGGRSAAERGLAAAPVPALASVVYLSSSRGGVATAAVGAVAFIAFTRRRWAVAGALTAAAAGSAAALWVLTARPALVDGPLGSEAASEQGRSAAPLLLLVCLATGSIYGIACRLVPAPPRLSRTLRLCAAVLAATLMVAAVVAVHPVRAFRTFKDPPAEFTQQRPDSVRAHVLSGGGSGRWQFWDAALDEFRTRPATGRGAGSYEAWWAEHGDLAYFVRDAHSLYLEVLGELGMLGLGLIVGAFAAAVVTGVAGLRGVEHDARTTLSSLLAASLAYAFAVGIDWMWEVTVVSLVGIACLGLLCASPASGRRPRQRFAVAAVAIAGLVALAQAAPLLGELELDESRAAVRRSDLEDARAHALRARDLQPWAASPYLELALIAEEAGDLVSARAGIREALDRDAADWRLWLVAARLDTKIGAIPDARRSVARARQLNPRSPLFAKAG